MNPATLKKITAAAAFLCSPEARKTQQYLSDPYGLCLQIFAALADGEAKTVQEIADLIPPKERRGRLENLPPSWNTVNKILFALKKGGIGFVISNGGPKARTWKIPSGKPTIDKASRE